MPKLLLFLFTAAASLASAGCFPVTGNRILGRDLALADPRFARLPASLTIGFAPAPGAQRVFSTLELQRLARANGVSVADPADICFEIATLHLDLKDALSAMRRALPGEAVLKIVELEDVEIPAGVVEFPVESLEPPALTAGALPGGEAPDAGVQLWRGRVRYAGTRSASIWARVVIRVKYTAVVAGADLPPDKPISATVLKLETRTGPLEKEKLATRIEEVAGRVPTRALKAGAVIPVGILAAAPTVRRGDPVTVDVDSGLAHIRFEAVAEGAGRDGDVIELRNPSSGRTFRARIGRGASAFLVVDTGQRL